MSDPWYESDEAYDREAWPQDHGHEQWEEEDNIVYYGEHQAEPPDDDLDIYDLNLRLTCLHCFAQRFNGITFGGGIFYCSVKCAKAHGLDPREGAWTRFELDSTEDGDEDE